MIVNEYFEIVKLFVNHLLKWGILNIEISLLIQNINIKVCQLTCKKLKCLLLTDYIKLYSSIDNAIN